MDEASSHEGLKNSKGFFRKVFDSHLITFSIKFFVEIVIISLIFIIIAAITLLIDKYLISNIDIYSFYWYIFKSAKWTILGLDLAVWVIFAFLFAFKLVYEVAKAELPYRVKEKIKKILRIKDALLLRTGNTDHAETTLSILYKTERDGLTVWSKGIIKPEHNTNKSTLQVVGAYDKASNGAISYYEYSLERFSFSGYTIMVGEPHDPRKSFESGFVVLLRTSTRCLDGEMVGLMFHDLGNTQRKSYSPAMLLKSSSPLLDQSFSNAEVKIIKESDDIASLTGVWFSQLSMDNLVPDTNLGKFKDVWIYAFVSEKDGTICGTFSFKTDTFRKTTVHGRAWYIRDDDESLFAARGDWSSIIFTFDNESGKWSILYSIGVIGDDDRKTLGLIEFSESTRLPNYLEGNIISIDGKPQMTPVRVLAVKSELKSTNIDNLHALKAELESKLEVNFKSTDPTKERTKARP